MPSDLPGASAATEAEAPHNLTMRAKGLSLNARIALVTVASAVVAMIVAGIVSFPLAVQSAQQESLASLQRLADATAAAVERRDSGAIVDLTTGRLAAALKSQNISVYYAPPNASVPGLITPNDAIALNSGESVSGERQYQGEDVLMAARGLSGGGSIVLVQSVSVTGALAVSTVGRFVLALGIGVAIAVIFGLLLARRLTRSLREAVDAARRLGQGDREVQLSITGPPEVADLSDALNELRNALEVSEGRQRDFLLSVSHELRTPLTAIRGYSEALADSMVDPANVAATGQIIAGEADRLNRLVSDLLELARLEAVDFSIAAVDVDYVDLIRNAAAVWQGRCEAVGVLFNYDIATPQLTGYSDPTRIRQIIDNLCENALRVTPAGGHIQLGLMQASDELVVIEVRDSGPGLTEADCAVAFEPAELYSRYRGIRQVGTGVGLALVGRLASRLGGHAQAGHSAMGGARFTITIAKNLVVSEVHR